MAKPIIDKIKELLGALLGIPGTSVTHTATPKEVRLIPHPEVLDKGVYTVTETPGFAAVNKVKKTFESPLDGRDPFDRNVVRHESLHLRYSPARKPRKGNDLFYDLAEDLRVNYIGSKIFVRSTPSYKLPPLPLEDMSEAIKQSMGRGEPKPLILAMMCTLANRYASNQLGANKYSGIPDPFLVFRFFDSALDYAQGIADENGDDRANAKIEIARSYVKQLGQLGGRIDNKFRKRNRKTYPTHRKTVQVANILREFFEDMLSHLNSARCKGDSAPKPGYKDAPDDLNFTPIHHLVLDLPMPEAKPSLRKRVATMIGPSLKKPHRSITDYKVFTRKRKFEKGTVLVDLSGSMGLSSGDIKKIADQIPSGRILGYGGSWEGTYVFLLAKGTRVVNKETLRQIQNTLNGANSVDVNAIRYMVTKCDPPYVWFSDGLVTRGTYEKQGDTFRNTNEVCCYTDYQESVALQGRYNIARTTKIQHCIDLLKGLAPWKRNTLPEHEYPSNRGY